MNLISFLTSPAADALGWTLLHAVWQGFVIVLPTAILMHLLRNRASALRYRLGVLALVVQLLTSVATFSRYYEPAIASKPVTQQINTLWQSEVLTLSWHQQVQQFLAVHLSQFVLIYLIGIVLFGLRLAGGWLYLQRLSRVATPPANATWNTLVSRLRATMRIRSVIQVRESARIAVPIVVGLLKPVLLIPVGLAISLSAQEVEAVLAHELAHIKRQDYAINLAQSLVEVLYFFHPALWWLSARVREERELCCDDLAVQTCGGDGRRLAQALARVEELRLIQAAPTPTLAMAFATKRLQLLHRVRRMLGVPTRPVVTSGQLAGLTLLSMLLLSVSVYAIQQQQPKNKTPEPVVLHRSKSALGSELHFDDKRNIQYVTWKGKELPASHVASLRRQWNQVISGQLNLDKVRQPDRDILRSIIESDAALEQETYHKIAESTLENMPLSTDGKVVGLETIENGSPIDHASSNTDTTWFSRFFQLQQQLKELQIRDAIASFSSAKASRDTLIQPQVENELKRQYSQDTTRLRETQKELSALTEQMGTIMRQRQPTVDRLTKEMAQLTLIHTQSRKQLEPLMQQLSKLAKQQGALATKLVPLQLELSKLENQQGAKSTALLRQKKQRNEQIEAQMNQVEKQIEALSSRLEPMSTKLEPYHERMGAIGDSIGKLYEPTYALSERIGKLSEQIAADAYRQAEGALRQAEDAFRALEINGGSPSRPERAPKAPRPPKIPKVAAPARPAMAPKPIPHVMPVPAPVAAPVPKVPKE